MANMKGPRFKQCRRLGVNVYGHPKAMNRATKGSSRADGKLSTYGRQLLEKQKLKAYYGVLERQFRRYVEGAKKSQEMTGDALLKLLECRLDNLVYRLGFAKSIRQARQMVSHGHIIVNGNKVDRPSFEVKAGDEIALAEKSKNVELFAENFQEAGFVSLPYLEKKDQKKAGILIKIPEKHEIPIEIQEHLVVEFYATR